MFVNVHVLFILFVCLFKLCVNVYIVYLVCFFIRLCSVCLLFILVNLCLFVACLPRLFMYVCLFALFTGLAVCLIPCLHVLVYLGHMHLTILSVCVIVYMCV